MEISTKVTNLGIELSVGPPGSHELLQPAKDADQVNPRRNYVYAHLDDAGKMFYIGKGTGRRAWSADRHLLWHRYVDKHLGGKYQVRILKDNLSVNAAEEIEASWIAQCSDNLVNWFNMGRATDFQALERHNKLREANTALIQQAREQENRDLPRAISMYVRAIEAISEYASISYEKGLIGKLMDEDVEENGKSGEINALDRLTMCLIKLDRAAEASDHANRYFASHRRDKQLSAYQRITTRIEKALSRASKRAGGQRQP